MEFDVWRDDGERERVTINPAAVAHVREYQDRRAYGGYNEVSEILYLSGERIKVYGHVAKKVFGNG